MKKIGSVLLLSFLSFYFLIASTNVNEGNDTENSKSSINWMTFEEAMEKNKTEPRKIFIDVYTDWCGWCKVMDKKTFSNPVIAEYMNDKYYAVKLDAEQKEDIEFNGTTFKFVAQGKRGYHELAAALLNGKLSYPTVVFMDEQNRILQPIPGFQKADQFDRIMKFFGEDSYKDQSWKDFQESYTSPF
ncbi:MAG: DUF255 domain-containing protein [Bacteroidota bacterium]